MDERKVHCPETDDDCTSGECSIQICLLRQERVSFEQRMAEWEADFRSNPANREAAAWQAFLKLVAEHNALVGADKTGVFTTGTGEIIQTRVIVRPERGKPGSKKFIASVLKSERPYIVTGIQEAMDALVAEAKSQLLWHR